MEIIKENIEYEKVVGRNFCDSVIKGEFLVPDTHPDISEILMVDAVPKIIGVEVLQDKIYFEGQIEYIVLYLAKDDGGMGIHKVTYKDKFSNSVEIVGTEHKMKCHTECYFEHIDSMIINERKVSLGGIVKVQAEVFKEYNFEIIKEIADMPNIQMLKKRIKLEKIKGEIEDEIILKSNIKATIENPEIDSILKCDVNVHRKEVKISNGFIEINAFAKVCLLYRGVDGELICLDDDILITKEIQNDQTDSSMDIILQLVPGSADMVIKDDDMGEYRIIELEVPVKVNLKVISRIETNIMDDVYSTDTHMEMIKSTYVLSLMKGQENSQIIIKENIELEANKNRAKKILMSSGKIVITDKKIIEDKVLIEGILKISVIYNSGGEDNNISAIKEDIPFSSYIDVQGSKIYMSMEAAADLESLETFIEANTIGIKALVDVNVRVNYEAEEEFVIEVVQSEEELKNKKASVIIYVVQCGDTLWKIAKKYSTTIEELLRINNIENPDIIKIGKKILIPGRMAL